MTQVKRVSYYISKRMPTPEEAAEHGVIILHRGTSRQKWRDQEGRTWSGAPPCKPIDEHNAYVFLRGPEKLRFWTLHAWCSKHAVSYDLPGPRLRADIDDQNPEEEVRRLLCSELLKKFENEIIEAANDLHRFRLISGQVIE